MLKLVLVPQYCNVIGEFWQPSNQFYFFDVIRAWLIGEVKFWLWCDLIWWVLPYHAWGWGLHELGWRTAKGEWTLPASAPSLCLCDLTNAPNIALWQVSTTSRLVLPMKKAADLPFAAMGEGASIMVGSLSKKIHKTKLRNCQEAYHWTSINKAKAITACQKSQEMLRWRRNPSQRVFAVVQKNTGNPFLHGTLPLHLSLEWYHLFLRVWFTHRQTVVDTDGHSLACPWSFCQYLRFCVTFLGVAC